LGSKCQWIRRICVIRRTLVDFRKKIDTDERLYRTLYVKAKDTEFGNNRVLIKHVHTLKAEQRREKKLQHIESRREWSQLARQKEAAATH